MGDLGGIKELVLMFFGFFIYPISLQAFNLRMSKHILTSESKKNEFFLQSPLPKTDIEILK